MSDKAPRGVRLTIAITGRRNAGKSSLINALAGQDIAIVSDTPGTTTDPVPKHYELLPLGPVTFYDTAGLDDSGELGNLRVKSARKILLRSDIALLVVGEKGLGEYEKQLAREIERLGIPFITVFNKTDLRAVSPEDREFCSASGMTSVEASSTEGTGIDALKQALITIAPPEMREEPVLAGDLIDEGDWVLCVVPIDLAAPKGRLILPQVQVLRDILDRDALAITVKEKEIEEALGNLRRKPALVITDSQAILSVAGDVPDDIPLTTFSTLFARYKGDLEVLAQGSEKLDRLEDGDRILVCEACSHRCVADDIGRVKIPRWISSYSGKDLQFDTYSGHDFPELLEDYTLAVHCGGCMLGRTEMLRRIRECVRRNVPVTNYGIAISKTQGVLDRVLTPFGI